MQRSRLACLLTMAAAAAGLLVATAGWAAEVYLDIAKGGEGRLDIAVPDFQAEPGSGEGAELSAIMAGILRNDLDFSGLFAIVGPAHFVRETELEDQRRGSIDFAEWSRVGAQALVKARYQMGRGNRLELEGKLFDVESGKEILLRRYQSVQGGHRKLVHAFADDILLRFTGFKGLFQTKIAFVSRVEGNKEIFIMDFDGHNPRQITRDYSIALGPAWSPDGGRILFTSYLDMNPDLYMIDVGPQVRSTVSRKWGLNTASAWSPDGMKIAFTMTKDGNPEIYAIRADGSGLQRLTFQDGIDSDPTWSPNGREIAFTSNRGGNPQIYVMSAEGSNVRRVTFQGTYNVEPAWAPRGNQIAYTSRQGGALNIALINVDGSGYTFLTDSGRNEESPTWSPDGRLIAYSSSWRDEPQIFVMTAEGQNHKQITRLAGGASAPSWSPPLQE